MTDQWVTLRRTDGTFTVARLMNDGSYRSAVHVYNSGSKDRHFASSSDSVGDLARRIARLLNEDTAA